MKGNDIYAKLAENLGDGDSERFMKILKATFTPDEATVCLELFEPATRPELAERLGMDEKYLGKMLDSLVDRGLLTRGRTQYAFHTTVLAFHHECVADTAPHTGPNAISQELKDLWSDYFRNEWSYNFMEHAEKMIENTGRSLPIWPAIGALERSPNINPEDILPEENFKHKIENAKSRILAPCGCRVVWGVCDHPLMTCFACFDRPRGEYYLNQPGRILKEVTLEEAMAAAREAEKSGLVHWGDCYCCDCCCENLFGVTRDKRYELMTPNRFAAVVDQEKCIGCKKCAGRCYFEAIEMQPTENPKKMKSFVIEDKCKGCGLCVITCKPNAMTLKIVRPPEYLKPKPKDSDDSEAPVHKIPVWGHYFLK